MRTLAAFFLLPTLALGQQALIEKGFAEFYLSGLGGVGKQTLLYGGEFGIGLNGEAALSVGYAGVDHENPTWHTATVIPAVTFAFHTKNKREQSVITVSLGISTGKLYDEGGHQGKAFNLGVGGLVKKPLNPKVTFLPGGSMAMAIPLGNNSGATMEAGISATAGFRFDWSSHSCGFVIPGVSIAKNIKAVTLEAGFGFKSKFKPQTRHE